MIKQTFKSPPVSYYFSNSENFNLTALLRSGQFYLDEYGLLVAPNGTRYRIPSGPPEGRKPLRPDRPDELVRKPKPGTSTGDDQKIFSLEQQDAGPLTPTKLAQPFLSKLVMNATDSHGTKPEQFGGISPMPTTTNVPMLPVTIDWDVILLTLILSSISLACNLGLLLLLSRKVFQLRKQSSKRSVPVDIEVNLLDEVCPHHVSKGEIHQRVICEQTANMCSCLKDDDTMNLSRRPVQSKPDDYRSKYTNMHHQHQRVRRRHKRYTNRRNRLPPHYTNHVHARRPPDDLVKNRLSATWYDKNEQGSSSGSSWKVVVSDGMISETTADEGETTEDSGNNSDALVHLRRSYWKRGYRTTGANTCHTDFKSELQRPLTSEVFPSTSQVYHLDTIRSTGQVPSNCEDNSCSSMFRHKWSSQLCKNTIYVSQTLGIHLALLGILLSTIQLITVCAALNRRMTHLTDQSRGYLSEVICILATSLAADTVLCARQYLLTALLAVFWTTFALTLLNRFQQLDGTNIFLSPWCVSNPKTSGSTVQMDRNTVGYIKQDQKQQRYAYLALVHSLPWAVAAGTALVITFAMYSNKEDTSQSKNSTPMMLKLNIFFRGLESLLVCKVNQEQESMDTDLTTTTPVQQTVSYDSSMENQEAELFESWVPPFLLILLPILVHILICLIYSILLRVVPRRPDGIKETVSLPSMVDGAACNSLCAVFVLVFVEFVSCAVPVIWSIIFPHPIYHRTASSIYVNRLILLHLLIDPWLIGCMLRSFSRQPITCSNSVATMHRNGRSTSQYSDVGGIGYSCESDNAIGRDRTTRPQQKHTAFTNGVKLQEVHQPSPLRLMNCLPVMNRSYNVSANDLTQSRPVLMSCVPNTGLVVSAVPRMETNPICADVTDAGYFVPIANPTIPFSTVVSSHFGVANLHSPNQSFDHNLSHYQPLMNVTNPDSVNVSLPNPYSQQHDLQDLFPQLCPHHQQLLDQHKHSQSVKTLTPVCQVNKNFGNVPRMLQTNVQFFDSFKMNPVSKVADAVTIPTECPMKHSQMLTPSDNTTTDESLQQHFSSIPRQYSGKSTATAAVMAAAAAAVAAHAGTMNRNTTVVTTTTTAVVSASQQDNKHIEPVITPAINPNEDHSIDPLPV